MHLAIINKSSEDILLCFKQKGADFFSIKDKYDKTPFDYAKEIKDEKYFEIVKKIFSINENEKENKNSNEENERILNLNNLFRNIDISMNINNKNDIDNEIKDNKNNLNINTENKKIINDIDKEYNEGNIEKNYTKHNYSLNKPQIYQPKKSIKNFQIQKDEKKLIKNNNVQLMKDEENVKEENICECMKNNNKIFSEKGTENKHNLGLGTTLISEDNTIHKSNSKTEEIINVSISNDKHPKLSTLSENELLYFMNLIKKYNYRYC
jgi:hypothetical protein